MPTKINSVDKAITVLNCFSNHEPVLSVGALSKMTGYTLSTVSRLMSTMEARGVVQRVKGHGRYQLGYRIYIWGVLSQARNHLVALARPNMETLRDLCGEEVSLYVVMDGARSCLQRVPSRHALAMTGEVGGRLPLHAGAAGRLLLAYMDEKDRREYVDSTGLERYTPNTFTDASRLQAELVEIRRKGYAISREERELGSFSVVAPVRETAGRVVASLCIAGPLSRFGDDVLQNHLTDVTATAAQISRKMGYDAPTP